MEALLFTIDGHRYGVWKNEILSVESIEAVHRLPFLKSSLTVLAVIGEHTSTLAELPRCLGHEGDRRNGSANALVMSDKGPIRGFMLNADLSAQEANPGAVVPLPDYLQIPFTEGVLAQDGEVVPVVAVRSLFEEVLKEGKPPRAGGQALGELSAAEPVGQAPFRLVKAGGYLFALQARELSPAPSDVRISRFPLLPADIDGVVVIESSLLPVVDLARRMSQRNGNQNPLLLQARVAGAAVALLVDGTAGEWGFSETTVKELPALCQTPWMKTAALHDGRAAPIIDLAALLTSPAGAATSEAAAGAYTPSSNFPSLFERQDVEVMEIVADGRRWAIPCSEVVDVLDSVPTFTIPRQPVAVAGIGAHNEELLPVLDLHRILSGGATGPSGARMILLSNGNFRTLIPTEKAPETKRVKVAEQRDVPVALSSPVVYGCYTDGDVVRLILNIHQLALHFDVSNAMQLFPTQLFPSFAADLPVREARAEPLAAPAFEAAPAAQTRSEIEPAAAPEEAPPAAQSAQDLLPEMPAVEERPPVIPEPEPAPAAAVPNQSVQQEQPFVEEPSVRKEAVMPRPMHRGWRMAVAFVGSVALIVGSVFGLYLSGLRYEPAVSPTVPAVTQQAPVQVSVPEPPAEQLYVVKQGDTLWDISNRLTGDPLNYPAIAGRNRIPNPDLIFPGQSLRTPGDSRSSR